MAEKRALITGITGQDGSYLAELLCEKGYEVYGLVRRSGIPRTDFIERLPIRLIYGDMTDIFSLEKAIERANPHEVYNLAGQSHVGLSFEQPEATLCVNGLAVTYLLEILKGTSIRFYQASTSEMYGNSYDYPHTETGEMKPVSPYACSKLYAHLMVNYYRVAYGVHASCGILFNHESPRRGLDFVTRKITNGIARIYYGLQDTIELGNLYSYRDWGFAGDYVRAMWAMLQQETPGDYVIATGIPHSVEDFLKAAFGVLSINDWHHYVKFKEELQRPIDIHILTGDASKAHDVLGWQPEVSFEQLVGMMMYADMERVKHENQSNAYPVVRSGYMGSHMVIPQE